MQERRVGLLIPSSNTVMEVDFHEGLPAWARLHTGRMYMEETTPEAEGAMLDVHALPAATAIATARPDVIVFGCTSAGALRGNDFDAAFCADISDMTRTPTISVIASVRTAITRPDVRRIGVFTPYIDELNDRIKASLEEDGDLEVTTISGLGITENFAIAEVPVPDIVGEATDRLSGHAIDLAFISCTNFRSANAAADLERELGVPVVTSNTAALEATIMHLEAIGSAADPAPVS